LVKKIIEYLNVYKQLKHHNNLGN